MTLRAALIEAFASGPCQGNGAGVVLLQQPLSAAAMQAIAGSLRQSETAFLLDHQGAWLLRWFTPSCEVKLCGHATLAALLALSHWGFSKPGEHLTMHTRSGPLATAVEAGQRGVGSIVLPAGPLHPANPSAQLCGLIEQRSGVPIQRYWSSDLGYHVALLPAGSTLAGLAGLGADLGGPEAEGLVVMAGLAAGTPGIPQVMGVEATYQLRFFAPDLGIPEDPVTGSAHALVAPYWLDQTGLDTVVGWQPSTRPGGMHCSAASSGMIRLLGTGHLLWEGTLHFGSSGDGLFNGSAAAAWPEWRQLLARA
jgi:predicted PhzF superfamily epimerase YddE/YHI9